jgi:hypothetical protein
VSVAKKYEENTLDAQLYDLFDWYARQGDGWHSQNVVHRILHDPGAATAGGGHRILHDVPEKRLRPVHQAYVLMMPFGQKALRLRYGWIRHEDGS